MPLVVAVHGIGHQRTGANTIASRWLPVLNDGLDRVAYSRLAAEHFAVAYYGDLFRPAGTMATDAPPFDATDITDPFEVALLEVLWTESAAVDPAVPNRDGQTMVAAPRIVQRALDALSHSRFFAGILERALIFDLKQVRAYITDDGIRRAAMDRLIATVGSDTRVLIGHSLGSVVAYEALCEHPEWGVRTFVTIGSPLGMRNLVFDRLRPAPTNDRGIPPSSIDHWFNISDAGDIVALVKRLRPLFGDVVEDFAVSNGATAHDARPYFTSREMGVAVASGLRDAASWTSSTGS